MFFYTGDLPRDLHPASTFETESLGRHDVWLTELANSIREATAHRRAEVPFAKFSTRRPGTTSAHTTANSRKTQMAPHIGRLRRDPDQHD